MKLPEKSPKRTNKSTVRRIIQVSYFIYYVICLLISISRSPKRWGYPKSPNGFKFPNLILLGEEITKNRSKWVIKGLVKGTAGVILLIGGVSDSQQYHFKLWLINYDLDIHVFVFENCLFLFMFALQKWHTHFFRIKQSLRKKTTYITHWSLI